MRIVTIGSGVTETVFALGRGRDVVATDAASLFPQAAAALPKLSYAKALSAESLLAHRPDLVLVADEAGPQSALDAAAAAGVRIVRMAEARRVDDVAAGARLIGETIDEAAGGAALAQALHADLAAIGDGLRGLASRRRALVLMGSPDAPMLIAAGRGSSAALALAFAGADNAAESISGWSWIAPPAAREFGPEAVVALSVSTQITLERVLAAPVTSGTPAGRDRCVATVDASAFTGFGPRAAHAIHAVASRIYPEIDLPAPTTRRWAETEITSL